MPGQALLTARNKQTSKNLFQHHATPSQYRRWKCQSRGRRPGYWTVGRLRRATSLLARRVQVTLPGDSVPDSPIGDGDLAAGQQDQPEHCFRDFLLRQKLLGHFVDQSEADAQAVVALRAVERFAHLRCAIWFGTFLPNWMLHRSLLSR
jgi:hypothetical protein